MAGNDREMDIYSRALSNVPLARDAVAQSGANNLHLSSFNTNALQALAGGQQFSFLDPNMMMMNNAAATIAAVAATAVQQINQGKSNSGPSHSQGNSVHTTALLAALRNAGVTTSAPNSALSPQIAALLVAASGGGHAGVQLQSTSNASAPGALLHEVFKQVETPTSHTSAPSTLSAGSTNTPIVSGMQSWSVGKLEQHVKLLKQMNQPVPQSVALLLSDAHRKQKKKTAKQAANRKSASTSRARKKALVEEMTLANLRLKRQALILALLPDLVIATTLEGEISFCSAQVERVLGHDNDDLVGVPLYKLLAPASRDALTKLIKTLVSPRKARSSRQSQTSKRCGTKRRHDEQKNASDAVPNKNPEGSANNNNGNVSGQGSSQSGGNNSAGNSGAAIVSLQSFPLSVVKVESKRSACPVIHKAAEAVAAATPNVNSDNSSSNNSGRDQQVSSLSNATGLSRSNADSPSEDDGARGGSKEAKCPVKGKEHPSSDESSQSSDAKNMCKANDNLDWNVRWHNERMMGDIQKAKSDKGPKDDVTGASVTANNASARLSSLQHGVMKERKSENRYENGDQSSSDDSLPAAVEEKKKVENESEDSGYRQSNDSREESSSSGSDSSNSNDRHKPIAPTCRLCLIRDDLTTVWCEVTSSMRTRTAEEEPEELLFESTKSSSSVGMEPPKQEVKELLLCLRPIRDGETKVDESLRFVSQRTTSLSDEAGPMEAVVSSNSGANCNSGQEKDTSEKTSSGGGSNGNSSSSDKVTPKRPPKKRPLSLSVEEIEQDAPKSKKAKSGDAKNPQRASDTEKSVVQSLMFLNKSQ